MDGGLVGGQVADAYLISWYGPSSLYCIFMNIIYLKTIPWLKFH